MSEEETPNKKRMLAVERRAWILATLDQRSSILTSEICEECGVSAITARSDLSELERQGKLMRTHGGAVSLARATAIDRPDIRASVNQLAKQSIASAAARLVTDGDSIFVDTGTTAVEFAKALGGKRNLTIVTNDMTITRYADEHLAECSVIGLGGTVRHGHNQTLGRLALEAIDSLYLDKVFLVANSFSPDLEFMTEFEPEGQIKIAMLRHAKHKIMMMDSSKIGLYNFMRFAKMEDFEVVITEKDPNGVLQDYVRTKGLRTRVVLADAIA